MMMAIIHDPDATATIRVNTATYTTAYGDDAQRVIVLGRGGHWPAHVADDKPHDGGGDDPRH